MKYHVIVEVDETIIRTVTQDNESPLDVLIEREAGWMSESGISFVGLNEVIEVSDLTEVYIDNYSV